MGDVWQFWPKAESSKPKQLGYYDERSAEELEEARWQTALMPMSHHRNFGVELYQPLLGGKVGFVDHQTSGDADVQPSASLS